MSLWETPQIVTLVAALIAVASASVAVFWAARAWPIGVRRELTDARERLQASEAIVEGLVAKWAAAKADIAGVLEEMEDVAESIERKRRRIAASESSRRNAEQQQEGQLPADPMERRRALTQLARSRGIKV